MGYLVGPVLYTVRESAGGEFFYPAVASNTAIGDSPWKPIINHHLSI